jgi:DNA-binding response OmpR family regulator
MSDDTVNRTVLLLEDEALIAVALQADLEEAGYGVAGPFVTCASALEWLSGHQPDLAILDTVLKDGPCKEVAQRLTSLGVPFLIYSGYQEDHASGLELTRAVWVQKPASAEVLIKALGHLCSRSGASV